MTPVWRLLSQLQLLVSPGLFPPGRHSLPSIVLGFGSLTILCVSFQPKAKSPHFFFSCVPGPVVEWDLLRTGSGSWSAEVSKMHICSVPAVSSMA